MAFYKLLPLCFTLAGVLSVNPAFIVPLSRDGWPDFVFAFHDGEDIGPRMLARIAKHTGLNPSDS